MEISSLVKVAEFLLSLFREAQSMDPSHTLSSSEMLCVCLTHVILIGSILNHLSEKVSFYTFHTNRSLSFCKASSGTNLVASPRVYTSAL